MKIKKYLSIAIGLLEALENKKHYHTANSVYDTIIALEETLKTRGLTYIEDNSNESPKGTLNLTIINEKAEGIISQVKFFPMKDTDTLQNFTKTDGKINFIRAYTNPSGNLSITLPVIDGVSSKYFVEISKGSEYEILSIEVVIEAYTEISITQTLSRIINLQTLGWYAGDLHHHSIYSSPVHGGTDDVIETPQEVAHSMQAAGLTYGALSDHHNILNHNEWQKTLSKDFTPIISKEISTSNGHVMALNVPIDIIYDIPHEEYRTEDFLRNEFIRITKQIKASNGLAQINHPRDLSSAISFPTEFIDIIQIFDTMEIWNGSNPFFNGTTNHKAYLLWLELLEEGRYIPATSGSDTHNTFANDYNKILDKITWLIQTAKPFLSILPSELQSEVIYLMCLYDKTFPLLEKWAEDTLGSGCVKTYIHLKDELSPTHILQSLSSGNSFLTNGPILIPTIGDKIPGETFYASTNKVDIDLILISNKPLNTLYIYGNGNKCTTISLENTHLKDGNSFNYSKKIKNFDVENMQWLFFVAASDFTNLAISNPIFITKEVSNSKC